MTRLVLLETVTNRGVKTMDDGNETNGRREERRGTKRKDLKAVVPAQEETGTRPERLANYGCCKTSKRGNLRAVPWESGRRKLQD